MSRGSDVKTTAEAVEGMALTKARVALAKGMKRDTAETAPLPEKVAATSPEQKSPAQWAYERIVLYIQKFEEGLDGDHEVGLGMTGSETGMMTIQGMGFFAPDIVTFYGVDPGGAKTQMIQHVTQLNVMLKAARKQHEEPNRIGFQLKEQMEADEV